VATSSNRHSAIHGTPHADVERAPVEVNVLSGLALRSLDREAFYAGPPQR